MNMGADFTAYNKVCSTHMGYGTVHVIRACMLKMVDAIKGTSYADRFEELTMEYHNHNRTAEELEKMWKSFISSLFDDCNGDKGLYGVYLFVDHSDCDGSFYGDDCMEIATSLKKLLDSDIDLGYTKDAIENLYDVFSEVGEDGMVDIC